jgi:thiol-disulfide isomerase/thioredoxin
MIGIVAALLALIAGVFAAKTVRSTPPAETVFSLSPSIADQLFATRMPDTNGVQQTFSQWKGKTLVINFWATWCPPCREEMPALSRLQSKHAENNVQFIGISIDFADNVKKFARQLQPTYPLLIGDAIGADLNRLLGNTQQALPYTLVLDSHNKVLLQRLGQVREDELDALLQRAKKAP